MIDHDLPTPLLHLKGMIWVHSVLGASLVALFFRSAFWTNDLAFMGGIVACGLCWFWALGPLYRKASALTPAQTRASTGIPEWILAQWFVVELLSVVCFPIFQELMGWVLVAYLLLGVTLFLRGTISLAIDAPFHRGTWVVSLAIVGIGVASRSFIVTAFWRHC